MKKSPVTAMVETIHDQLDQLDEHAMNRWEYIQLLETIKWNLEQHIDKHSKEHVWQALGLVKGALNGLGK